MSITCRDSNNKPLQYYTQWDSNQVLKISGLDTSAVPVFHFFNKYSKVALVVSPIVSEASIVVKVPNILLQQATPLVVQLYYQNVDNSAKTEHTLTIPVRPKPKPADYEYKENIDYVSLEMLDARMQQIIEAISNSSTAANSAELLDMRTSYDGVVYDTAGEAIREVTKKLYDAIRKSTDAQWDSHSETIFEYVDLDNVISGYSGDKSLLNIYIFDESEVPQKGNYLGVLDDINDNSILLINKATGEQWSYIKGSNVLVESRNNFIHLGEIYDIKMLDFALGQNNYDKNKVYRFSFKDDITIQDFVVPGKTEYIGYVEDKENYGITIVFESLISDGIKRVIGFEPYTPGVYLDYWEEPVITVDTKQDFLNSGDFKTLEEIHNYNFQYEKIYRINITEDIKDDNDVIELPKGLYLGYMYYSATADDFLKLFPFVPDGNAYTIIHGSIRSRVSHSYTFDQNFDPESPNAQSGKAIAEAILTMVEPSVLHFIVKDVGMVTSYNDIYEKLTYSDSNNGVYPVRGLAYFTIDDGGLIGSTTDKNLPEGEYITTKFIGTHEGVYSCLNISTATQYTITRRFELVNNQTETYYYDVYTDKVADEKIRELNTSVENIKTTLDGLEEFLASI